METSRRMEGAHTESKEIKKNGFDYYIKYFRDINTRLFPTLRESIDYLSSQIETDVGDDFVGENFRDDFTTWKSNVKSALDEWYTNVKSLDQELKENGLAPYVGHDVNNVAGSLFGYLSLGLDDFDIKKVDFFRSAMEKVIERWDRYWVALEDVMLRGIDKEFISPAYCKDFDLKSIYGAITYLTTTEYDSMKRNTKYSQLEKKNINVNFDLNDLQQHLAGRDIKAPAGFIGNYVLNALRNTFQDRIEATQIELKVFVEDNSLIIRIIDDGKGMLP